ncbi:TPA: DUF6884 domain-containing protein [Klebsiella pneumoniae]
MTSLIIMACSATKGRQAAPAMDLYQGVMYSTFRANAPAARPAVVILSAKHGFIEADRVIEPYEQRMTEARADEMIAELAGFDSAEWPAGVHSILLAGGKTYRRVMRAAIKRRIDLCLLDSNLIIEETSGGIGYQRAQLGAYLRNLPDASPPADRQLIIATRIISDYTLRFIHNNKGAKLAEIKERIEGKVKLLVGDGCNENSLRKVLSAASGCHSRAGVKSACETLLAATTKQNVNTGFRK